MEMRCMLWNRSVVLPSSSLVLELIANLYGFIVYFGSLFTVGVKPKFYFIGYIYFETLVISKETRGVFSQCMVLHLSFSFLFFFFFFATQHLQLYQDMLVSIQPIILSL